MKIIKYNNEDIHKTAQKVKNEIIMLKTTAKQSQTKYYINNHVLLNINAVWYALLI